VVISVTEDDLFSFIAHSIGSVWTLELLILLKRQPGRSWDEESLIRELRSSSVVVREALQRLQSAGLVIRDPNGRSRYQAASPQLDRLAFEISQLYAAKPMTVIKAMIDARTDKLRAFSDAFKLKG
jgi:DNA-binding GntR family transcriptional regulator